MTFMSRINMAEINNFRENEYGANKYMYYKKRKVKRNIF